MTDYILTKNQLPEDGKIVETISEEGQIQKLIYKNRLWWVIDYSMYVYYVPKMWRYYKKEY